MDKFTSKDLKKLKRTITDSRGERNGQLTIIGGSSLFHGAPIFSLRAASRMVDMVFFIAQVGKRVFNVGIVLHFFY